MTGELSETFSIAIERVPVLISFCTAGTVCGLIIGPAILKRVSAGKLLLASTLFLGLSQLLFTSSHTLCAGVIWRFVGGVSSGLVASVMWHLTFHDIAKKYFQAMVAVLMSSRPLAVALGVPIAGLLAGYTHWQIPMICLALLCLASGLGLFSIYPKSSESEERSSINNLSLLYPYKKALQAPYALTYYLGTTINRMSYFGFYTFCGLWFIKHYNLELSQISLSLFFIGLGECLVNFFTGTIIKKWGHRLTFVSSVIISSVILPLYIYGKQPLNIAIALIAIFMILDRIYSMVLIVSIPDMFNFQGDKTALGSLNTLTAWGAMTLISALQSQFTELWGITNIENLLIICFLLGTALVSFVQIKTTFKLKKLSCYNT